MLKFRIIPCMLFNGSWLVKTINFSRPRTLGNPIQMAKVYNSRNVDELILLDIYASLEEREPEYESLIDIARECFMPLAIGGGIKNIDHISKLLQIGADKVVLNTISMDTPQFIKESANKFGSQCVIVSIDVKNVEGTYYVFRDNGKNNTGIEAKLWAKKVESLGAGEIFLNSIDHDGKMNGFDINLFTQILSEVNIPVIGCGGANTPSDFSTAAKESNVSALSAASIFHYTQYTPDNVKSDMKKNGYEVRL